MNTDTLTIRTGNPQAYSQPTYSNYGTVTNSREQPTTPPAGAGTASGYWGPRADGATGWQWYDNPGYNHVQSQKESEANIAAADAPPAGPTEIPGAFGSPRYNPFALQRQQPQQGMGAFGAGAPMGGRSDSLVPQLEQIRMQRIMNNYPQNYGQNQGGMYGVQ